MKLRLPQALLSALMAVVTPALPLATTVGTGALIVAAATQQAQARDLATNTTTVGDVTYNGCVFTMGNITSSTTNFASRQYTLLEAYDETHTAGKTYQSGNSSVATPYGNGWFWTLFTDTDPLPDSVSAPLSVRGVTLRLAGATVKQVVQTDFSDFCLGGLIVEESSITGVTADSPAYWFKRSASMAFNGTNDVNLTINDFTRFSYKVEIAVKKGGVWNIAQGKALVFDNENANNPTNVKIYADNAVEVKGGGTLRIGTSGMGKTSLELATGSSLTVTNSNMIVNGDWTNAGTITNNGVITLGESSAMTFSLNSGSNATLGGSWKIGTASMSATNATTFSGTISNAEGVDRGALTLASGDFTFNGAVSVSGLTLNSGATATISVANLQASTVTLNSGSTLKLGSNLAGLDKQTITGSGTVELGVTTNAWRNVKTKSDFSGTVHVNNGWLELNANNSIGTGTWRFTDGARLYINSGYTCSSAMELGTATAANGTEIIVNNGGTSTISGNISTIEGTTGGLWKTGGGTLNLTGASIDLGKLYVGTGKVQINNTTNNATVRLGTVTVDNGLTLFITRKANTEMSISNSLTLNGGTLSFETYNGNRQERAKLIINELTLGNGGGTLKTSDGTGNWGAYFQINKLNLNGKTLNYYAPTLVTHENTIEFRGTGTGVGTFVANLSASSNAARKSNVLITDNLALQGAAVQMTINSAITDDNAYLRLTVGAENATIRGVKTSVTTANPLYQIVSSSTGNTYHTLTLTGTGAGGQDFYGKVGSNLNIAMASAESTSHQKFMGDVSSFNGDITVSGGTLEFANELANAKAATITGGNLVLGGGATFTSISGTGGTVKTSADSAQTINVTGVGATYSGALDANLNIVMNGNSPTAHQQFTGDLSAFNGDVTLRNGALTFSNGGDSAANVQNLYLADGKTVTIGGTGDTVVKNFGLDGEAPADPSGTTIIKQGAGKLTLETSLLSDTVLQLQGGSLSSAHSLGSVQVGTGTTLDTFTLNGGTLTFGSGYFDDGSAAATLTSNSVFSAGNIDMGINFADVYADGLQYTLFNQTGEGDISWGDTTLNGVAIGTDGTFYVTNAQNQILGQASVTHADGKIMLTFEDIEDVPDSLTWNGSTGVWTSGTSTWEGDGLTYADGDLVFFTPDSEGTVTLQGQLDPTSVNVTGTYTFAAVDADSGLTGEGVLTVGDGTTATALTLNSNNSGRTGATIINDNASLTICSADALGSGGVDISADGTLDIVNAGATTIELGNRIGGTGTVGVTGSVSLTGDVASFGGVYDIEQGADLTVAALGSNTGANLKGADSVLSVNGTVSGVNKNNITGSGTVNISLAESGTNTFSTADGFAGTVNVTGGVLALSGTTAGNGSFLLQDGVSMTVQNGETADGTNIKLVGNNHDISLAADETGTLKGNFTGSTADGSATATATLTKTGAGTLVLGDNTDITAAVNVDAGTLQTGGAGTAVHGTLTVNAGGTLDFAGGSLVVDALTLNGGSITGGTSGSLSVNGTFDTGSTNVGTLGKGKTVVDPSGSSATAKLTNFTGGENFKKTGSGNLVVGGTISLTKSTISEGIFQVVLGNSAVNLGEIVLDGGTFSVYNNNQTGNWNTITKLTVNNNASKLNSTWNRSLIDIQELVFTDDGDTLVIEDTHTSSGIAVYKFGGTTTGTGTIKVHQADFETKRHTAISLAGTDTLKYVVLNYAESASAVTQTTDTERAINVVALSTANAKLAGLESAETFKDDMYLTSMSATALPNAGNLKVSETGAANNRTLTLTGDGATHTFYGKVMGNVNITMGDTGDGAVTMAEGSKQVFAGNAAAFNGTITVNSGTLQFDQNVGKLDTPNASSAAGIVMNGGTLQLGGDTHASTLTGDSATAVITSEATGTAMLFLGDNSTSETVASNFAGTITGSMGVTVRNGANDGGQHNTLTLTGKNTYSGATAIWNNAKLDLEDGGSIGNETSGNQFIIYGRAAQLNISGGGYIQNSGIKISNDGEGATAQLQGFVMTKTGIDASQATVAASQGTISNAAITVSANGGEDKYSVANVALADSTVTVASGKTLAIGDNVGASGLSLSTASGATEAAKLTSTAADATGSLTIAAGSTLKVTDMEISNIAFATGTGRGTVDITAGALLKGSVSEGASETAPTDTKALMASCSLKNSDVVVSAVGATEAFAIATDHTLGTPYTLNVMSGVQLVDMDSFSLTLNGMEKYTNVQVYWEVVEPATQSLMPGPALSQALNANGVNVERYNGSAVLLNPGDGKVVNVWVTYNIPEPATGVLSMLALAGLAARRRRK